MLRLRSGVNLENALFDLRLAAQDADNLANVSGGRDLDWQRNEYLNWINNATGRLQNVFGEGGPADDLHSVYFWRIRELVPDSPRAMELISQELRRQSARINGLRCELERLGEWFDPRAGIVIVPDTHIFLHYQRPDSVDWPKIARTTPVRIALPLRVVEELDEKKYTARSNVAQAARNFLSWMRKLERPEGTDFAPIAEGVSLGVFLPELRERHRPSDADQEILETVELLTVAGVPTTLITGDAGVELRARALGLAVTNMPDEYLRVDTASRR